MIYKDYKVDLDFLFTSSVINFQDLGLHLFFIIISACIIIFFPETISNCFIAFSVTFWLWTLSSIACYFLSSFKNFLNVRVTFKNMVSLYLCCVSTIVFSSSWFIFILFWQGIFNYLAFYNIFDNVFLIYFF